MIPLERRQGLTFLLLFWLISFVQSIDDEVFITSDTGKKYCEFTPNMPTEKTPPESIVCNYTGLAPGKRVIIPPLEKNYDSITVRNAERLDIHPDNNRIKTLTLENIEKISETIFTNKSGVVVLQMINSYSEGISISNLQQLLLNNSHVATVNQQALEEIDIISDSWIGKLFVTISATKSTWKNSSIDVIEMLEINNPKHFVCDDMKIGTIRELIFHGASESAYIWNSTITTIESGAVQIDHDDISLSIKNVRIENLLETAITINGILEIRNSVIENAHGKSITINGTGKLILNDVQIHGINVSYEISSTGNNVLYPLELCFHAHYSKFEFWISTGALIIILALMLIGMLVSAVIHVCKQRKIGDKKQSEEITDAKLSKGDEVLKEKNNLYVTAPIEPTQDKDGGHYLPAPPAVPIQLKELNNMTEDSPDYDDVSGYTKQPAPAPSSIPIHPPIFGELKSNLQEGNDDDEPVYGDADEFVGLGDSNYVRKVTPRPDSDIPPPPPPPITNEEEPEYEDVSDQGSRGYVPSRFRQINPFQGNQHAHALPPLHGNQAEADDEEPVYEDVSEESKYYLNKNANLNYDDICVPGDQSAGNSYLHRKGSNDQGSPSVPPLPSKPNIKPPIIPRNVNNPSLSILHQNIKNLPGNSMPPPPPKFLSQTPNQPPMRPTASPNSRFQKQPPPPPTRRY